MIPPPLHTIIGWLGTIIGLTVFGLFAGGFISETWFFGVGIISSSLLASALAVDKAYYGVFLQGVLATFNIVGFIRILF